MRYLTAFFAAIFFANNVAAAAYACLTEITKQTPAREDAGPPGSHHGATGADDSWCLAVCIQTYNHREQDILTGIPVSAAAPAPVVVYYSVENGTADVAVASTPIAHAPPLTILFRNFRS